MNESKEREIFDALRDLHKKVDELSGPSEDVAAYRIFDNARASFKKWIGLWLTFLLLFLAAIGVGTVREGAKLMVEKFATLEVKEMIIAETKKGLIAEAEKELEPEMLKIDAMVNAELASRYALMDDQLAGFTKEINDRFAEVSAKIAMEIKDIQPPEEKADLEGWVYYGMRGDSVWQNKYFDGSLDPDAFPEENSIVIARANVNARDGHIKLTSSGWQNQPVIGLIRPEDRLQVIEVKRIAGAFIWIKFKRLTGS